LRFASVRVSTMTSIVALAQEILDKAKELESYATAKSLGLASLEKDTFAGVPAEQEQLQIAINDKTQALRQLVVGPVAACTEILHSPNNITALRVVYTYKMVHHIPLEGSATYGELAKRCGLAEDLVRRFIRQGVGSNIFMEKEPGRVSHSSITRLMIEDPGFEDYIGLLSCEVTATLAQVPEALAKWPGSQEPNETAFTLAWPMRESHSNQQSLYQFLNDHPERARRFGGSMQFLTKGAALSLDHLTSGSFDWTKLDKPGSLLVDIGGGHGAVVQHLAMKTKHLRFIVQDQPTTIVSAKAALSSDFQQRIEFMEHNFYQPQPVTNADIYFFRWIFHNLNDITCVDILRNLRPAMRDGVRVIVFEMVLPDHPPASWAEKLQFDADMHMQALFNARERDEPAWRDLFQRASKSFIFRGITHNPGSSFSIIEYEWQE